MTAEAELLLPKDLFAKSLTVMNGRQDYVRVPWKHLPRFDADSSCYLAIRLHSYAHPSLPPFLPLSLSAREGETGAERAMHGEPRRRQRKGHRVRAARLQ